MTAITRYGGAPKGPGDRPMPFSRAVRAGDFVFVSGQVPLGEDSEVVPGGIVEHTHQTMKNVISALASAGAELEGRGQVHRLARGRPRFFELQQGLPVLFRGPPAGALVRRIPADGLWEGRDRSDRVCRSDARRGVINRCYFAGPSGGPGNRAEASSWFRSMWLRM